MNVESCRISYVMYYVGTQLTLHNFTGTSDRDPTPRLDATTAADLFPD